jgi:hypothetical protein
VRIWIKRNLNDTPTDFAEIARVASLVAEAREDVVIEFHGCGFLRYNAIAALAAVRTDARERGYDCALRWDTARPDVQGFVAGCGVDGGRASSSTAIPYRHDRAFAQAGVTQYLRSDWLGRGWLGVSDALRDAIVSRTLEIYVNAFEHAHAASGIHSCGQYYPRQKHLGLTAVDCGIGIPGSVRTYLECDMSDGEALSWAIIAGNTTKGGSQGLGFDILRALVSATDGVMQIHSGTAGLVIDKEGVRSVKHGLFPGTLVNIRLLCDNRARLILAREDPTAATF